MPYTKTTWTDRVVQNPLTFTQRTNADGTITLIPAEGNIVQAGTPITANVMNNLENQYDEAINWAKGFGLGDVAKDISNTDLNALDATGFYRGQTLTNAPNASSSQFYVMHIKHTASYKFQMAIVTFGGTPSVYHRVNNNGVWSAWQQTITDVAPTWTNLTLQNGATGSTGRLPRYTKVGKMVTIEGEIANIAAGTTIATLPAGYRPPNTRHFKTAIVSGTANDGVSIYVDANGAVVVYSVGAAQQISLMGISFYVD